MTENETSPPKKKRRLWLRILGYIALAFLVLFTFLLADAWRAMGTTPSGERLERLKQSPNFDADEEVFVNPLPPEEPEILEALSKWLEGGPHREPETDIPVLIRDPHDFDDPPASGLRVTWLGHSSMFIEIDGKRFLTDPIWGERASPSSFLGPRRFFDPPITLADLPTLDAVVISHDHYDHLDMPSIDALNARGVTFVVPLGVGSHLEYWDVPAERIIELDWWESTTFGSVEVHCTPSRHFSGRSVHDRNATLWASWSFAGPEHRAYFSGDTGMFPGFAEIGERLGPFDITMMESGAYNALWADVHLGPEQAVTAHQALRGELMVPIHWGTFNLALHTWIEPVERLIPAAKAAGVRLAIPRPGGSVEPRAREESMTRWWPDLPWESAQEAPVVSSGLGVVAP